MPSGAFHHSDVVVARHDDRLADAVRVADERLGALELARARALREITRDRDDVESAFLDDLLDRFDLFGDGRATECRSETWKTVTHRSRCRVTRGER